MKDNNVIKTKMGRIQAIVFSLVYLLVMLYFLSGCSSSHRVVKECCSHSGVKDTSVSDTKVNLDLVKKDGVVIILPTITTKDTIK